MNIIERIETLRFAKGWSVYKLAAESGLSDKAIYNWLKRGTLPTIKALENICDAFGITMSQFFAEGDMIEINTEFKELLADYISLSDEQKNLVKAIMKSYKNQI